jgi:RND family efflux transporter MFP subunit
MFSLTQKLFGFTVALSTLLISGCDTPKPTTNTEESIRPAKLFTVKDPSKQSLRNFPAEVEANAESKLAFRVHGQVIDFPIKPGAMVKKGDVLATLDPKDFELQLDDRKARYDLAKSKFDQAKLLLDRKLGSKSNYDEAKANLGVALSSLNVAKSNVEYTLLHAPFSGNVSKTFIEKHDHIQANQPILSLQTRDLIDLTIQMPENIVSRALKGATHQPTVIFDSYPDKEYLATIKEFDTVADSSTLTYKVVFSLPSPTEFNALPGMSANIRIDLSKITSMFTAKYTLPIGAVFSAEDEPLSNNKKFVWKVNPDTMTVNRVEVEIGELKSNGIEVLTGLTTGDQVVAAGSHFLTENMKIRPWNREKGL